MFYLDQMGKRRERDWQRQVTAVNQGLATWYDRKANRRFARQVAKSSADRVGLTGAALEWQVMSLAMTHPEYVVVG